MALVIVTWLWGTKYSRSDVIKLASGIQRNLRRRPYRFLCITDQDVLFPGMQIERVSIPESDRYLLNVKGCFVRLRMFDPQWQAAQGVDERMICIDLDTVTVGHLDPLFDRPERFVILQGGNAANPCPYGGALMMLRPGVHPELWSDFTLDAAAKIPFHEFPDDQGWIAHKVMGAAGWKCGRESGVYVFRKPGWPANDELPHDARLVTFNGWRNPQRFQHLKWVRKNWR